MNPPLNVTLVVDQTGLDKVADFLSRVDTFALDTETNVVNRFFNRRIRTIQIGDRNEQYVIDLLPFAGSTENLILSQGNYYGKGRLSKPQSFQPTCFDPIIKVLKPALESDHWLKVGANLQFDYEILKWCLGLRPWHFWDIQLAEKVYYAGSVGFFVKGFWGLEPIVARHLGLQISKDEQKTFDLSTPLTEKQVIYAGLDGRLPVGVMNHQRPSMERPS
jgi:ribonuclease D